MIDECYEIFSPRRSAETRFINSVAVHCVYVICAQKPSNKGSERNSEAYYYQSMFDGGVALHKRKFQINFRVCNYCVLWATYGPIETGSDWKSCGIMTVRIWIGYECKKWIWLFPNWNFRTQSFDGMLRNNVACYSTKINIKFLFPGCKVSETLFIWQGLKSICRIFIDSHFG